MLKDFGERQVGVFEGEEAGCTVLEQGMMKAVSFSFFSSLPSAVELCAFSSSFSDDTDVSDGHERD